MPWGGYDFSKKSMAVIASNENGDGAVVWSVGPHILMEQEETGLRSLDELGLVPDAAGIWIWEGKGVWQDGPWEHPQDGELILEGEFRVPTDEEWNAIRRNECPWNDDDWLDPNWKNQILSERSEE